MEFMIELPVLVFLGILRQVSCVMQGHRYDSAHTFHNRRLVQAVVTI